MQPRPHALTPSVQNQATFSAIWQERSASESAAGLLRAQFCVLHVR
jgi:hypothetical protein